MACICLLSIQKKAPTNYYILLGLKLASNLQAHFDSALGSNFHFIIWMAIVNKYSETCLKHTRTYTIQEQVHFID